MELKLKNRTSRWNRKAVKYTKENYIDIVFDVFLIFIFDILTGLFFIRLIFKEAVKIIAKEYTKDKLKDQAKTEAMKLFNKKRKNRIKKGVVVFWEN